MSVSLNDPDRRYNYQDYLGWSDKDRYELIDGVPYNMTPAPSTKHQRVTRELILQFGNYLRDKPCEVFNAPFNVRLFAEQQDNKEIDNVVQPDISVICDSNKIDEQGCKGSPDL